MQDRTDNNRNRTAAYRVLAVELLTTLVLALLLLFVVDTVAAYSAAVGGLAFILPNALFARYVFRHSAAESAARALHWFFVGEAIKVVATVLIFAACFTLIEPLNIIALFGVFLLVMVMNLVGVAAIGAR